MYSLFSLNFINHVNYLPQRKKNQVICHSKPILFVFSWALKNWYLFMGHPDVDENKTSQK